MQTSLLFIYLTTSSYLSVAVAPLRSPAARACPHHNYCCLLVAAILISFPMIITKPTPPSPLKPQLNGQGPPSTNSGQPQSPPPYAPYLENRPLQPDHVEYRQSPGRRFFEAFCVAVVIYLLAAMFTSSVARAIHPRHHPGRVSH